MAEDLKNGPFVINLDSSIKDAMASITDNQRGTVVVVDDDFYVQGIVADGDIRRAMLRGATMLTPISKILNANPVILNKGDFEAGRAEEIFKEEPSINVLPVVGENNKLIDVAIRSPQKRREL